MLISCSAAEQLICIFVFAYADGWFSDAASQMLNFPYCKTNPRCKFAFEIRNRQTFCHGFGIKLHALHVT